MEGERGEEENMQLKDRFPCLRDGLGTTIVRTTITEMIRMQWKNLSKYFPANI